MSSCVQGGTKLSISGEYNNKPRSCPINIIIQFIAFISNSVIRFSCSRYFNDQSCNFESLNHSRFCVSGHLLCFILNLVSNFAVGCIHCGILEVQEIKVINCFFLFCTIFHFNTILSGFLVFKRRMLNLAITNNLHISLTTLKKKVKNWRLAVCGQLEVIPPVQSVWQGITCITQLI